MTRFSRVNQKFNRWISSIAKALPARGVVTTDELGRRMAETGGKR